MHASPRLRTIVEAAGLLLLRVTLFPFPPRWASLLGVGLGWLLFTVFRLQRSLTLENLAFAFGDTYTPRERLRIASRCYRHFGAVITEFLTLPRLPPGRLDDYIELDNREVLDAELQRGHGVLIATGHLGNWELMGSAIAAKGYAFSAYGGQQHNLLADAFLNAVRRRMGMAIVPKRTAMLGMVRALKGNRVLTILSDQHFSRNSHFVRFFGRPVSTAPGLGTLVRHCKTALVFAETHKTGRFRYRTRFIPLRVPTPSGDEELDLLRITQQFMDALEAAVRRHPEQYFWMHRRWRPPPTDEQLSATNRAFLAGDGPRALGGASPSRKAGGTPGKGVP